MAKRVTVEVIRSSGNVFADLGLPDAEELYANAKRIAAVETENFFMERRNRADDEAILRILNRKGGEAPRPEDAIE